MNTTTTLREVPKPRTPMAPAPVARPSALPGFTLDPYLTLTEELLHAGADPDEVGDDWLLGGLARGGRRRSLLGRVLGRA